MQGKRLKWRWLGLSLLVLMASCQQPLNQDPDFSTDFDLEPPTSSSLTGVSATTNQQPSWQYDSGGNGAYLFRYRLNGAEWQQVTHTPPGPYTYTPPAPLPEGIYVFEVQERDDRGNWSEPKSFRTAVDLTPPEPPSVTTNGANPTSNTQPTWVWSSNTGNGNFVVTGDAALAGLPGPGPTTSYTPPSPLPDGSYTLSGMMPATSPLPRPLPLP